MTSTVRLSEVKEWPSTVDVTRAAVALGISRSHSYRLALEGRFPCRVLQIGDRYRVITTSLIALLEEPDEEPSDDPGPAAV